MGKVRRLLESLKKRLEGRVTGKNRGFRGSGGAAGIGFVYLLFVQNGLVWTYLINEGSGRGCAD